MPALRVSRPGLGYCASLIVTTMVVALASSAQAHTSIAVATEDVRRTVFAAYQYSSAAAADAAAIEGCRKGAVDNGVPQFAALCTVVERQTVAGFGALVCGDEGCGSGYGNNEALASAAAMQSCQSPEGSAINNCSFQTSLLWQDLDVGGASSSGSTRGPAATPHGPPTAAPASSATTATAAVPAAWQGMLESFLTRTYGAFDTRLQCWPYVYRQAGNEGRYCMRGLRSDWTAPGADGQPKGVYLLVAGDAIDENGEPQQFNAASGLVGAFYLERQGNALLARSAMLGLPVGSGGEAPKEWELVTVAQDRFGFRGETSFFAQGYYAARSVLLVRQGARMADVGFNTALSDEGRCGDDATCNATASDLRLRYEFDSSKPATPLYPLRLHIEGKDRGRAIAPRTLSVPFDSKSGKYVLPKDPIVQRINAGL